MRRIAYLVAAMAMVILLASVSPVFADPPGMAEGDGIYYRAVGGARFTQLEDKGSGWLIIDNNGIYGWIVHGAKMSSLDGSIEAKGLRPDSWYLVTFDAVFVGGVNPFTGSDGLFGVKSYTDWQGIQHGFVDVALFKSDSSGHAKTAIPTTSGLTAAQLLVSYLGSGNLAPGAYTGVTVAIKYVGASADGTTPNLTYLWYGGFNPSYNPLGLTPAWKWNLYECQALPPFVIP